MKKVVIIFAVIVFAFTVGCKNDAADMQNEPLGYNASSSVDFQEKLREAIKALCSDGYACELKEKSMIGDVSVDVFALRGEPELTWLFAFDSKGNFYVDRSGDGNWQNIGVNENGDYYIGQSAVTTHTEDEYVLFVKGLSSDVLSVSEDIVITGDGQDIIDKNLLKKYSVNQGDVKIATVAINDTLDIVYISRGESEFEIYTDDLSKYQAKG